MRYEAVGPVRDSIVRWRGAGLRVERKRQCRVVSVGSDGAQDEGTETGEGGDLARVIVAWLFVHMSSCCSCVRGVIWHIPSDMY